MRSCENCEGSYQFKVLLYVPHRTKELFWTQPLNNSHSTNHLRIRAFHLSGGKEWTTYSQVVSDLDLKSGVVWLLGWGFLHSGLQCCTLNLFEMETSVHHKETFHRKFTVCVWDLPFCYSPQHHAAMKYSLAPHVPPLQAVVQEEGLSILQPIVIPQNECPFKKHIGKGWDR